MTPETVMNIGRQAVEVTILVASPVLLVALVVGLLISVFQAATSLTTKQPFRSYRRSLQCS